MGCSPSLLFLSQKSQSIQINKQDEECSEATTPVAIVIRSTTVIAKPGKEGLVELLSRKQHALLQDEIQNLKKCWKNTGSEIKVYNGLNFDE